jgi:hypothetical protein
MVTRSEQVRSDKYFASLPAEECATECLHKVDSYYLYLKTSGRISVYRKAYEQYYKGLMRGAQINQGGVEGEYSLLNVNHFRNILLHIKNMTTQQLPGLTPRASNTDYKSMAQTITATGLLDYYINEKQLVQYIDNCVEISGIFGEAQIEIPWDANEGEDYVADPVTKQMYKSGDMTFNVFSPMDIIYDFYSPNHQGHQWKIIRKWKNRFDLATQYPNLADKILDLRYDDSRIREQRVGTMNYTDSDLVAVYTMYHNKTAGMPQGRVMEFASENCVMLDSPLPYKKMPIFRMAASEQIGSSFGYTIGFDLLALQDGIDGLNSTILTNQRNYGVQNICMPTGSNISVQSLAGGLNLITYDPKAGKPEGLNLTMTPPEIFKFLDKLESTLETISAVNATVRGNPEANLKSGSALALVASMAIQFSSDLQKSYAKLWSDVGTHIIQLLQTFPQTKRSIVISGKDNKSYQKEFEKQDVSTIDRVVVDLGNPLTRTTAGKVDIATNLLQQGLITDPEQYITVLTTGKLEPIYQGRQAELMLIKNENEILQDGKTVQAIATDQHSVHLKEHKVVIASVDARQQPGVVTNVLAHMTQHLDLLRNTDPALLAAVGEQSVAPIQQPGMPGQPEGQPGNANVPPNPHGGKPGSPGREMSAENSTQEKADTVKQPNMPTNPLTKEKFSPGGQNQ